MRMTKHPTTTVQAEQINDTKKNQDNENEQSVSDQSISINNHNEANTQLPRFMTNRSFRHSSRIRRPPSYLEDFVVEEIDIYQYYIMNYVIIPIQTIKMSYQSDLHRLIEAFGECFQRLSHEFMQMEDNNIQMRRTNETSDQPIKCDADFYISIAYIEEMPLFVLKIFSCWNEEEINYKTLDLGD
ncbi:hypothetical protein GJ496_001540 [Pomphorhynchus laevis]|nr:hypothetical protein GJ496_001540 [Pomphorhynchus laevis]